MAITRKSKRASRSADCKVDLAQSRCSHCGAMDGEGEGPIGRRRRSPARYDADEARAAPWGRRPDGTPHTLEQFRAFLRETVRELYGVSLTAETAEPAAAITSTRRVPE
ncbi:hypothetical protein RAS2_30640 [Phycisphaerae bacterium RAS2]|nr:hypothetical protein RAS2_30640 [Phycisphaerae bacterium RAS2]